MLVDQPSLQLGFLMMTPTPRYAKESTIKFSEKTNILKLYSFQKQFGQVVAANSLRDRPTRPLPTRSQQLQSLQEEEFDVLVIGGGATGAGCALDSVSRGIYFIFNIGLHHKTSK